MGAGADATSTTGATVDGGPTGGSTTGVGGTTAGGTTTGTSTPMPTAEECASGVYPGRAPIRRLTRFEYNNTVNALLGDDTSPGNALPAELSGNGFGNDADNQPVSAFLAEQYGTIAEDVVSRVAATPEQLAKFAPCVSSATADTEATCARSFVESFLPLAYRRPVEAAEVDELLALEQTVRQTNEFAASLSAVVEAALQSPDYLYRIELGSPDTTDPTLRRPSGYEMASRLSYFLWGSMPDATLETAAASGELSTPEGVLQNATWMLDDPRARPMIRHFFDNYLPINTLTDLARDAEEFPTFSPTIGALMHEETQTFLDYEIFDGPGTWPAVLTEPYTFVNEALANFYGISGVTGDEFRKVDIDTTHRLGLLTQGSILAGTTISNFTNPVRRGVFLLRNVLCVDLPPPPSTLGSIKPPDPYSGATGRERFEAHVQQAVCATCHTTIDPPGFALENYDAVGMWRDQENDVTIDASGQLDMLPQPFNGPIELVNMIAQSEQAQSCFADTWLTFAYGRTIGDEDLCNRSSLEQAFAASGYNIKQLLLSLTQTDAFLYLPSQEGM